MCGVGMDLLHNTNGLALLWLSWHSMAMKRHASAQTIPVKCAAPVINQFQIVFAEKTTKVWEHSVASSTTAHPVPWLLQEPELGKEP